MDAYAYAYVFTQCFDCTHSPHITSDGDARTVCERMHGACDTVLGHCGSHLLAECDDPSQAALSWACSCSWNVPNRDDHHVDVYGCDTAQCRGKDECAPDTTIHCNTLYGFAVLAVVERPET